MRLPGGGRMRLVRCVRMLATGRCLLSTCGPDRPVSARYGGRRRMSLGIEPMPIHRIHCRGSRPAVVNGSKLVTVMAGCLLMGGLLMGGSHMPLSYNCLFLCGGSG